MWTDRLPIAIGGCPLGACCCRSTVGRRASVGRSWLVSDSLLNLHLASTTDRSLTVVDGVGTWSHAFAGRLRYRLLTLTGRTTVWPHARHLHLVLHLSSRRITSSMIRDGGGRSHDRCRRCNLVLLERVRAMGDNADGHNGEGNGQQRQEADGRTEHGVNRRRRRCLLRRRHLHRVERIIGRSAMLVSTGEDPFPWLGTHDIVLGVGRHGGEHRVSRRGAGGRVRRNARVPASSALVNGHVDEHVRHQVVRLGIHLGRRRHDRFGAHTANTPTARI